MRRHAVGLEEELLPPIISTPRVGRPNEERLAPVAWALSVSGKFRDGRTGISREGRVGVAVERGGRASGDRRPVLGRRAGARLGEIVVPRGVRAGDAAGRR